MKSKVCPASKCVIVATILAVGVVSHGLAATKDATVAGPATPYYKVPPVFNPYPEPGKSWAIRQYGPVGISIELIAPAFTIRIGGVEAGSPAEATGKLKKGQIIESINGETLKDIDPRVQLAQILEKAEATDGLMKMKIKDDGEVVVKLPVLGAYSKTWPLNCPKSAKIVRNLGDQLAKLEKPDWSGGPFLLSTGEAQDFETFKRWLKMGVPTPDYPWYIGFYGTSVCEYYLRTGDQSVIPAINKMAAKLKASMYNGGWMGRGSEAPNFGYVAGGHMNAAGVHALSFLMLAKECGAEVDEYLLQRVLFQFFRFAGRDNVAYGDQLPEGGFRDNGKSAGLAMAMGSAASLCPEGEASVYAAARDNCAMKSFYATTWFNRAHTGGGIGEIWHGVAMQLLAEKKPLQYRTFMDERKWFYEIARRHDGTFSLSDNAGSDYEGSDWGNYFALAYTASRKKLRTFGAPKTEWCKTHALPKRPWGTAADDAYYSMKPGEYMPGKFQDMGKEIIATDASGPIGSRVFATNATDETLLMYAYHPDHGIRSGVASAITKNGRTHLILPLLKSKDPRGRGVGVLTLAGMFKGAPIPVESMTDEMYGILAEMITDPEESRWVAFHAMTALARGPAEKIIPLTDRLLYFLKQDDWWIQTAALKPLAKIATDERVYQKVLPAVGDMAAKNTAACGLGNIRDVAVALASAKPEIKELGLAVFAKAYAAIPDRLMAPGGADLAIGSRMFKGALSGCINAFLEGADLMLRMPKMTSAWSASRKESDKYIYNGTFAPNKALVGKWQTVGVAKSAEDYQAQLAKEAEEEAKAKEAAAKQNKPVPPPKPKAQPRFGIGALDLQDGGMIGGAKGMVWSGIMLINGGSEEALKMEVKSVQGKEYLLVETGGFNQVDTTKEEQPKWNPNYYVMERVK